MNNFMFDTNIFNHILDFKINLETIKGKGNFFVTHIQQDEINDTPDSSRKKLLIEIFTSIVNNDIATSSVVIGVSRIGRAKLGGNSIPTESALWGISHWGESNWGNKDGLYQPIKDKLDSRNNHKKNNPKDALIAETSIKNNFTLITHDKDLYSITTYFHGSCANFYHLLNDING